MKETAFETHLPYIDESTLAANEEKYLYIQDDGVWGLQVPADSGYILNDGPGKLEVRTSDNGERYSKARTLEPGDRLLIENDDDELVHTMHILANSSGASYRSAFTRSRW